MPRDPADLSPAIEALLRRFELVLRGVIVRFRMSRPDADELIQDVRIRVWKLLESGTHSDLPATYFKKVVMSAAVDLLRRRRRRPTEPLDEPSPENADVRERDYGSNPIPMPDRLVDQGELGNLIMRAVRSLSDPRDVVVGLYLQGYDRHEIADLLGWTEGKARNLLYRGLDDLRTILRKEGVEPGRVT